MIILVSGATKTVRKFAHTGRLGRLLSPRAGNSIEAIEADGLVYAADNDAFGAWDQERFYRMLEKIAKGTDRWRLLWVVCPDVVGDAQATVNRWHEWYPQLEHLGLHAAFVGQNGLEGIADQIPWDDMRCFFIGGDDRWKLSAEAERLAGEAKTRGKWVHMGRCQTEKRIRHAVEIGCDSIDGLSFSAWPDLYIPKGLRWIRKAEQQEHFLIHR